MTIRNFRAVDFKKDKSEVKAVASKRDRTPRFDTPVPTTTPIIAPDADPNEVPVGTVPEILTWVGEDKEKAQKALDKELENSKPRKGLVSSLEEVVGS